MASSATFSTTDIFPHSPWVSFMPFADAPPKTKVSPKHYLSWSTAATHIQIAVDASLVPDEISVPGGAYPPGDYTPARRTPPSVIIYTSIAAQSVNAPAATP